MKHLTNLIRAYLRQLSASSKKPLLTKDTTTQKWTVIEEINGKAKQSNKLNFPRKLKIDNKIKTDEDEIANEPNIYFADVGQSLAKNIPDPSMVFESFLSLSLTELQYTFFT